MRQAAETISKRMAGAVPADVEEHDEEDSSEVEFPIPKGYKLPSGVVDGDEFSALGTFKVDQSEGTLTLTKLEGMPVSAQPPDEEEASPPKELPPGLMTALRKSASNLPKPQ